MGGKDKKAKASTAKSAFNGLKSYNVDLGSFASGTATDNNNTIDVNSQLSSPLQGVFNVAAPGLENNASFLALSPTDQLQQLDSGQNSFYNLQSELNRKQLDQALGSANVDAQRRGIQNSTTAGAREGQIINDAVLRDLSTRNESLGAQNSLSLNNASMLQNTLNSLYGYQTAAANAAQQGLMQGLLDKSQTARTNAQLQTQANLQNAQQSGGGFFSSLAPTLGTIAGTALGGPVGGAIGGALGSGASSLMGGGSSGSLSSSGSLGSTTASLPSIGNYISYDVPTFNGFTQPTMLSSSSLSGLGKVY